MTDIMIHWTQSVIHHCIKHSVFRPDNKWHKDDYIKKNNTGCTKLQTTLTLIQINTPNKTNMNTQSSMTPTTFQTTKGTHGQRSGRSTGGRDNEGCPSWLTFGTIGADLIFGEEHEGFEAFFEFCLGHGCGGDYLVLVCCCCCCYWGMIMAEARAGERTPWSLASSFYGPTLDVVRWSGGRGWISKVTQLQLQVFKRIGHLWPLLESVGSFCTEELVVFLQRSFRFSGCFHHT